MSKSVLFRRLSVVALFLFVWSLVAISVAKADTSSATGLPDLPNTHHVVFQVSSNDPAIMNLALNNITNVENYYAKLGKNVRIELVTYGPGLNMLRDDTSPVKERLKQIKSSIPEVAFSACNVTLQAMEKAEGKKIAIVPEAGMVPAGVIRIMTLEEAGWSYIKP